MSGESDAVFRLPDLGEGLREAEIVGWHVSAGEHVVTDQPLVSVETDKAVVEVPAPHSGRIKRLCAEAGAVLEVGAPLVEFETEAAADAGTVVGEVASEPARVRAAPAVRKLARDLGVDLATVKPTGAGGTVTGDDVRAAARGGGGDEPLRGPRRAMAANMTAADAVRANVTDLADVEAWLAPENGGQDVTGRLIRAVARACAAAPALNAWYDADRGARHLHANVDLGLAVNTDEGLFVPVLRDAGGRDADDLRAGLDALKRDVAARTIPPARLRGATITLSNFGVLGGRHALMVVPRPQVAIVGAGRAAREPVAVDGGVAVHWLLPLSVTFDHRAATGAEAAAFLMALKADLELPD